MIGLLRKDIYIIVKEFKPVQFIPLTATIAAAALNPTFFMLIFSIMIAMIFAFQVTQTMSNDESSKWARALTAMPISRQSEAGSKYLLLLLMASISTVIVFIVGLVAGAIQIVSFNMVFLYTLLGFAYVLLYGAIIIPATYKFGSENSRYVFMLFIFIPALAPLVFQSLKIDINIEWLINMKILYLIALVMLIMMVLVLASLYISVKILKKIKYKRL